MAANPPAGAKPPAGVQVALTFDHHAPLDLEVFAARIAAERGALGEAYNVVELVERTRFLRFFGANERMITIEQSEGRLNEPTFARTLASPLTRMMTPDAAARLAAHRSYTLIEVSHGAIPSAPELDALIAQLGVQETVHQPHKFADRLEMAVTITGSVIAPRTPSLVHWTQSDTLTTPATFAELAKHDAPSLLHIHPFLSGHVDERGRECAGFCTLGAEHFIGREIAVAPAPVPFAASLDFAMAFLRMAMSADHYTIPHGETFGPSTDESMAVRHLDAPQEGGPRLFELTWLRSKEHDYVCPAAAVPVVDATPPADDVELDPNDPFDRAIMERLARRAGGDVVAQAVPPGGADGMMASPNVVPGAPPARPKRGGFGRRRR